MAQDRKEAVPFSYPHELDCIERFGVFCLFVFSPAELGSEPWRDIFKWPPCGERWRNADRRMLENQDGTSALTNLHPVTYNRRQVDTDMQAHICVNRVASVLLGANDVKG